MARTHEIRRAHVAIGERAHRVRPFLGRDPGGESPAHIDGDGEGGAERGIIRRHHRIEAQAARLFGRQGRADDTGGVTHDEGHRLRRRQGCGDEKIALPFAILIIRDDDDLAGLEGRDCRRHAVSHGIILPVQPISGRKPEEIIRCDGASCLLEDQRRRLPRDPGAVLIAELRHGARRDTDCAREIRARDPFRLEPCGEFHGRRL